MENEFRSYLLLSNTTITVFHDFMSSDQRIFVALSNQELSIAIGGKITESCNLASSEKSLDLEDPMRSIGDSLLSLVK